MRPIRIQEKLQDLRNGRRKAFALLIDPDKTGGGKLRNLLAKAEEASVDYLLIGGSLLTKDHLEDCLGYLEKNSTIPRILFPGDTYQISSRADGILLLSLISGRNPELLIGKQVAAAPYLNESKLEILPTGYILIDGGRPTTASYISGTLPIPADKPGIAWATALAGQMLGLRLIFLDAGSGARKPVSPEMIRRVSEGVSLPLIVGGGIRTPEAAYRAATAGADMVVVGNAIEKNPSLLKELAEAVHEPRKEGLELE